MATMQDLTTKELPNWCPGCVLPGTLIQTNPSAKKIEEIKEGERVLGLDGKYHEIEETMVHRHKGKMYRIVAKCFGETTLTGEHPVMISRREKRSFNNKSMESVWERADRLKKGDYLLYPILKEEQDLEYTELHAEKKFMDRKSKRIPSKIRLTGDFLRLAGYYIAEGHVHKREITFTFNRNEQAYAEDVSRICKKVFGLEAAIRTRKSKPSTTDVAINSSRLARTFEMWFGTGATRKQIPNFLMLLPKEKQKELIKGMWRGDGWTGSKRANYKTTSPVLKEQLKQLLLRQGIVPTISVNKAYKNHKVSYSVQIVSHPDLKQLFGILGIPFSLPASRSKKPPIMRDESYAYLPIRKVEEFDYDGLVHNFEVAEVSSYVSGSAILHNCGDFNILFAMKNALAELNIEPENAVIVSGIGCGSKLPHFVKGAYGFEGLHGRALPVATGIKLANKEITVIATVGDGDCYGIGGNHLLHAMRRNIDMTVIVQNNAVYGLTKGQYSPTSRRGFVTPSSRQGAIEEPVNPLTLGITTGASFVARGYAYEVKHLQWLMSEAIKHKGFALIDVFQPCSTYNKVQTIPWYKQTVYKLEDEGHDAGDFNAAMAKAMEWGGRIPIGLFFKDERSTYDEDAYASIGLEAPPVRQDISSIDISSILQKAK